MASTQREVLIFMVISFVRTIILYIAIIIALRVMGKKQIGELQPSELVVAISIADLACIPMQATDVPLVNGLVPIITLVIAEVTFSFFAMKSRKFRRILTGRPSVLVRGGKIVEKEMERLRFNLDDLLEALRTSNCTNITDVDYAILETNGQLNVIMKSDKRPLTPADMGLNPKQEKAMHPIISDGELIKENLKACQIDEAWLARNGISDYKNIFYAAIDEDKNLFFQKKSKA